METDGKSKQTYSSAYYQHTIVSLRKKARERYHDSKSPTTVCICGGGVDVSKGKRVVITQRHTLLKFD